jgi:hypothetical protein
MADWRWTEEEAAAGVILLVETTGLFRNYLEAQ